MTGPSKSFIHKINQSAVSLILSIAGKRTFQTQRTKLLSVEFTDSFVNCNQRQKIHIFFQILTSCFGYKKNLLKYFLEW